MDITKPLAEILRRCVAQRYGTQAEFARAAQLSSSMASRILGPSFEGMWCTEPTWERVYNSLLPQIADCLGPEYLPRSKFAEALASLQGQHIGEEPSAYHPHGTCHDLCATDPIFRRIAETWPDLDEPDRLEALACVLRLQKGNSASGEAASTSRDDTAQSA